LGLFSLAALLLPAGVTCALLFLKTFAAFAHLLNGYLIGRFVPEPRFRSILTTAYLLNPIALLEFVVNGRIDASFCTLMFVPILNLRRSNYVVVGVALLSAFVVKSLALIYLPMYGVYLLSRRRWPDLTIYLVLATALIAVLTFTILSSRAAWGSLLNSGVRFMSAGSIHHILDTWFLALPPGALRRRASLAFHLMTSGLYCVMYAGACWKLLNKKDAEPEDLLQLFAWFTLALLLLATPWYQPWYATSLLLFLFLAVRDPMFWVCAAAFAFCGTIAYYTLAYGPERIPLLAVSLLTVLSVPTVLVTQRSRSDQTPSAAT
jgi:alpha-1,6-mannosyltransferase